MRKTDMKPVRQLFTVLLFCLGACPVLAAGDKVPIVDGGNTNKVSVNVSTMLPLCASCHGVDGVSTVGLYPNLAGQKVEYLLKQLHAFKTRERNDPVMSSMAEPLSNEAIQELAEYFSSRK